MLADQFAAAADRARTMAELEDVSRLLWRAHAEQHLADADADGPCRGRGGPPSPHQGHEARALAEAAQRPPQAAQIARSASLS